MCLETDLLSPNVNALENKSDGSTDSVNNILIFSTDIIDQFTFFYIYIFIKYENSLFSRTRIICVTRNLVP